MKRTPIISIAFYLLICCIPDLNAQNERLIHVDFTEVKGLLSKTPLNIVGAGRAAEGLRADWQAQLRIVRKECGFRQIRFHGVLNEEMGLYKEDVQSQPIYDWTKVDKLYDLLVEIGMKPFVELSFMPADLRTNDETTCYWKAYKSPPKSYPKYEAFIEAFVRHLRQRYGHKEVKTWYFEVWNEPNIPNFFTGDIEEYFKIYTAAAKAIKSVSPKYRVGGPATAGTGWILETMDYCNTNKVPLDFLSTHFYGNMKTSVISSTDFNLWTEEDLKMEFFMKPDKDAIPKKVNEVRQKIQANQKYKDLELHFNEWSTSYDPVDPIHDAYQSTPYMLNVLKKTEDIASSMGYWIFTDICEEIGEVPTGYCMGNWGLMDTHGNRKPAYFTYKYFNQLGNTELVNSDSCSWVCKTGNNIQALFWNYKLLDQKNVPNNVFYKQLFPSEVKEKVTLRVENMKNGKYEIVFYRTGFESNDYYTAYAKMGAPQKPSNGQIKTLADACKDEPIKSETVEVKNGILELKIDVRENDALLVKANFIN